MWASVTLSVLNANTSIEDEYHFLLVSTCGMYICMYPTNVNVSNLWTMNRGANKYIKYIIIKDKREMSIRNIFAQIWCLLFGICKIWIVVIKRKQNCSHTNWFIYQFIKCNLKSPYVLLQTDDLLSHTNNFAFFNPRQIPELCCKILRFMELQQKPLRWRDTHFGSFLTTINQELPGTINELIQIDHWNNLIIINDKWWNLSLFS